MHPYLRHDFRAIAAAAGHDASLDTDSTVTLTGRAGGLTATSSLPGIGSSSEATLKSVILDATLSDGATILKCVKNTLASNAGGPSRDDKPPAHSYGRRGKLPRPRKSKATPTDDTDSSSTSVR